MKGNKRKGEQSDKKKGFNFYYHYGRELLGENIIKMKA
jgi:hypothetical protein